MCGPSPPPKSWGSGEAWDWPQPFPLSPRGHRGSRAPSSHASLTRSWPPSVPHECVPSLPQTRPLSRANRTAHISTRPVQVSYHLLRSREAGEGWAPALMKCGVWGGGWERGGSPRSRASCSRDAGISPEGPPGDADGGRSAGTPWLELRDQETQVLRDTFPSARPCRPHTGSRLPSGASAQPIAA